MTAHLHRLSFDQLDALARQATIAACGDDDAAIAANTALEQIHAERQRRREGPARPSPHVRPPRPPRSPNPEQIERRKRAAFGGAVPWRIAAPFTPGEIACLAVIARAVQHFGQCTLAVLTIAKRAGVCETVVHNVLRAAETLDLLHIVRRPRPGDRSDTNIITVSSTTWAAWLKLSGRQTTCTQTHPRRSHPPLILPKQRGSSQQAHTPTLFDLGRQALRRE